jgi:hypothetical protein
MALTSPGVQVSVVDESFYTPAEPGTVPMIFVATAANKTNGAGTGIAPGTTAANAGKPYLLTSQRDLTETFGDPIFYTDTNNNAIHAGELNEYGLQAAYSLLGVSNRAWVVRADIDLGALQASADAPADNPANGAHWLDTASTAFGIFAWNSASAATAGGQSFSVQTPLAVTDKTKVVNYNALTGANDGPKGSVGAIGDYAVVSVSTVNKLWYKSAGNGSAGGATAVAAGAWCEVGSQKWTGSIPSVTGGTVGTIVQGNDMTITPAGGSATTITAGATVTLDGIVTVINSAAMSGITAQNVNGQLALFNDGAGASAITIAEGSGLAASLGFGAGATDVALGSYATPELSIAPHTSVPQFKTTSPTPRPTGSVWVKTTEPNAGARWRVKVWNADTELWDLVAAPIHSDSMQALYSLDKSGGGANLAVGELFIKYNWTEATDVLANFVIYRRENAGATTITSDIVDAQLTAGANDFTIQETSAGSAALGSAVTVSFTATGADTDADVMADAINGAGLTNIVASVDSVNRVVISHSKGGDFRLAEGANTPLGDIGLDADATNLYTAPAGDTDADLVASNWKALSYTASEDAPTQTAADGTLWYSSVIDEVDMMVHDGTTWRGIATANGYGSDAGVTVSATAPSTPDANDIWVSTADLENYPTIYRYNGSTLVWDLLDATDQTTEDGVLFADARWNTDGLTADEATIAELAASDFLDPDAPDPALYPQGMLLWNTRRSGFNVKKFVRNAIDVTADNPRAGDASMASYYPHRWQTESGNQEDGSGSFGRIAQRKVVVQQLQATMNSNDDIRDDESRIFNLLATPGYPELIGEMVSLNFDRGLSAFIVGDSPARLSSNATALNDWGQNVNLAVEDNDNGLVSRDEYLGVFYPWGFSSDNAGNNVVVPPSHMMLRTIALSDQVSYPWFAPAGTRRGGITNATATGYVNAEGEFVSVALNEGQRDTLYSNAVNPITFINGAGLVAYGQKTRARGASSLDRVNVARLVIYLRSQLNKLAKPYIFEPNDKITRDQIKQAAESLCLELVGARALYDFLVVCDESNNTPARIDRNELYLDIAIEPVKAIEFVYIPLRLKNTGEIAGL